MKSLMIAAFSLVLTIAGASPAAHAESVFEGGAPKPIAMGAPAGGRAPLGAVERSALRYAGEPQAASATTPRKAALSSLLLPGLGQRALGHELSSKIYFGLEGIAWIAVGSYLWVGHSRAEAYRDYAVAFAGVTGTGHPDDYYGKLADYMASDGPGGYNEVVRQDARDIYYPDVAAMDAYYEAHKIPADEAWRWRSSGAFERFGTLREGSRFANRVALYSLVAAGALRLVSAADALRLARTASPASEEGKVSLGLEAGPQGASLYVRRSF